MRFLLLVVLAVSFFQPALADEVPEQQRVLIRFLETLDQPSATRREFIRQNMTADIIQTRSVEGLDEAMASLSGRLGAFVVYSVEVTDNAVAATIHLRESADWVMLVLPIGGPPAYKIDGINVAGIEPPAGVVPAADANNITEVLSGFLNAAGEAGFSGVALVTHQNRVLYAGAFGLADNDPPEHNTLLTAFNIGPVSSMFTSVMIMKMVEEGKLDLDASVGTYLPDWANERVRNEVNILHLLTHRSGIPPTSPEEVFERRARLRTVADYTALFADKPLLFTPGSRFEYSDSGIVLLGRIAERVGGKGFDELMDQYIYELAGMDSSGRFSTSELGRCCAVGIMGDGRSNTALLPGRGSPASGSYATAVDLARFSIAFMGGDLVPLETVERMIFPIEVISANEVFSVAGFLSEDAGHTHVGYRIGGPGIGVDLAVYPEQAYTVIVLSNQDNGSIAVSKILRRIIGQLMESSGGQ